MAIRLIALDLDGTLLNDQRQISSANGQALTEAAAGGIKILITTGRRFDSARPLLRQLPCPATIAASNGALIGTLEGKILRRNFLPRRVASAVLNEARNHLPYAVVIHEAPGHGQVVMLKDASPLGPVGWYLANAPEVLLRVSDLVASLKRDPVHIMFGGPPAVLDPLEKILAASRAAPDIHLTWTRYEARNLSILDVLNRGCSKGTAVEWFIREHGIQPSEVMAIGDNFNDVEMLELAGISVLMGNAPAVLGCNGWHRTLSNLEDGVAVALRAHALA